MPGWMRDWIVPLIVAFFVAGMVNFLYDPATQTLWGVFLIVYFAGILVARILARRRSGTP